MLWSVYGPVNRLCKFRCDARTDVFRAGGNNVRLFELDYQPTRSCDAEVEARFDVCCEIIDLSTHSCMM